MLTSRKNEVYSSWSLVFASFLEIDDLYATHNVK